MATNVMNCPLCGSPSFTFKLYVSHLRLVHSKDPAFNIMCGVDGCREIFGAFSAFNSHVYRHHRPVIGVGTTEPQRPPSDEAPGPSFLEGSGCDMPEDLGIELTVPSDSDEDEDCSTRTCAQLAQRVESREYLKTVTVAKFILQLREGRQISQVAISDVTIGCKSLCKQTADKIKGVKAALASSGINCENIPGLTDVLDNDPDPFQSIDSNYLFEKFCSEHLGYLVS